MQKARRKGARTQLEKASKTIERALIERQDSGILRRISNAVVGGRISPLGDGVGNLIGIEKVKALGTQYQFTNLPVRQR